MYDDVLCTFLKTRQHKTTTTATLVKIDPWLFGCVTLHPRRLAMFCLSYLLKNKIFHPMYNHLSTQSSLSIFAQKYRCKCENTYSILQNENLCIYEASFGAKILRDDCTLKVQYRITHKILFAYLVLRCFIWKLDFYFII